LITSSSEERSDIKIHAEKTVLGKPPKKRRYKNVPRKYIGPSNFMPSPYYPNESQASLFDKTF
jgi:hypothetical protein